MRRFRAPPPSPEVLNKPCAFVGRACSFNEGVPCRFIVGVAHEESTLEFLFPDFSCREAREDFRLADDLTLGSTCGENLKEFIRQVPPKGLERATCGIEHRSTVPCRHTGGCFIVRFT